MKLLHNLFLACTAALLSCNSSNTESDTGSNTLPLNPGAPPPNEMVSWQVRSNQYYMENSTGPYYVYVSLRTGDMPGSTDRVPLNISLVLDSSGSMSGDKIVYARKAAKFVIDQLGSEDYLSIVNYDDEIEVTSPSLPVRNKESLKAAVERLTDRGSTNMTGGMLEGYKQVAATKKNGYVNRVLLLTDGLANIGITDPSKIKKLVAAKYAEQGIALSTFGLGADYNEDMLTMLAETGHANYFFIDKAERIPEIFAQELKGLLSVVAQDAYVTISLPAGVYCSNVYGYPHEAKGNTVTVRFNDLYSSEEKGILLELRGRPAARSMRFDCSLAYTGTDDFRRRSSSKSVTMDATANSRLYQSGKDIVVEEMIALFKSTEIYDEVMADVDKGNYNEAKTKARRVLKDLQEQQAAAPSAVLRKQEEEVSRYLNDVDRVATMASEEKAIYQKSSKNVNYEVKKMKRK